MLHVLIADDDVAVREGLKKLIQWQQLGARVVYAASNGREALEYIQKQRVDILISDIKMPDIDGLELCSRIASLPDMPEVLLLSAYAEFEYAQKAMCYGIRYYILKPINTQKLAELSEIIDEIVKKRKIEGNDCNSDLASRIKQYIDDHYSDIEISVQSIADAFGISVSYLRRIFSYKFEINLLDYIIQIRLKKAKHLLRETQLSVFQIAKNIGYADEKHFMKLFKQRFGYTPTDFRKANQEGCAHYEI